jgi:hypothetical protein
MVLYERFLDLLIKGFAPVKRNTCRFSARENASLLR